MDQHLVALHGAMLGYCESLMSDVREEEMHAQPTPGVNTPAWLVGHLAIGADYALQLLGAPARLPAAWGEMFGPGSTPDRLGDACPGRDELMAAYREGHAAVAALLPEATAERLAEPNPIGMPLLQKLFPTVGDMLAHLVATHEAMHLGHLSNWRRQQGRPPLF